MTGVYTDPNESPFMREAIRHPSHEGPALLFDWVFSRRLTDPDELAFAVPNVWSDAHLPFNSLGYRTWVELFEMAGYTVDGIRSPRPLTPVTLYRAAEPHRVHRLAWTGSLEVARRFLTINASRYGDKPRFVYTVTVDPSRLLAHVTDRQEDEYVTDTRGLKVRRVAESSETEKAPAAGCSQREGEETDRTRKESL